ncbi:MAG: type II toxin-antitoxin system Phd/YefM family antitoxin [Bradymonadaceae bacterium]
MSRLTTTEARKNFADALNRVAYGGDRIILDRNGKTVAALISVEDLELLQMLEDRMDMDAAREALAEGETIDWEDFKKDLES